MVRPIGFGLVVIVGLACIARRPERCEQTSSCAVGSVCDGLGFCVSECKQDNDCPCGAYCNPGCGICLRQESGGLATCFAARHQLSAVETLGACRTRPVPNFDADTIGDGKVEGVGGQSATRSDLGTTDAASDRGGSCLPPPTAPSCELDAGGAGGAGGKAEIEDMAAGGARGNDEGAAGVGGASNPVPGDGGHGVGQGSGRAGTTGQGETAAGGEATP